MDHLWKNEFQVWAYRRPATGYPATRAQENWARNYTYLLSSHHTHKVLYSLPNWYSFAAMVPEHSTHTYCRNTVYQNHSEPNHSEGSKTTFETIFMYSCCWLAAKAVHKQREIVHKNMFQDTLCALLKTVSVRSKITHIEVYKYLVTQNTTGC